MNFLNELRYAFRVLFKNPGFAAVAVFTLAVCIAANAAMFSMADAIAFRPFPFKNLDRIVALSETIPQVSPERYAVSPGNFFDWKNLNRAFSQVEAYKGWDAAITGSSGSEQVQGYLVSPGFFSLLGSLQLKGRVFSSEQGEDDRDQVVVSYKFWQERLGADPNATGRLITLNGLRYTIIAVMPKEFEFPIYAELWTPWFPTLDERNDRTKRDLSVVARLKPGVTLSQAEAEMNNIGDRLAREYPLSNSGRGVSVMLLREISDPYARRYMAVLMGAVAFLLLLACANVANLQLARGAMRRKEMALRLAIGASRGRLARQLLTEGLLLSLCGAALGMPLALSGLALIKTNLPNLVARHVPSLMHAHLDVRMLVFTVAAAILTGIASTLPAALQASPDRLAEALKESARGFSGSDRTGLRSALVISEVAFAVVLLIGAGLMVNGSRHLASTKPGIDPTHVLTFHVTLRGIQYREEYQQANFYKEMLRRFNAIPGIQSAAVVSELPALGDSRSSPVVIEGQTLDTTKPSLLAEVRITSDDYFRTMAIPIREGRAFTSQDAADAQPVALASANAARRFWPGKDVLGRSLQLVAADFPATPLTVVGIVGDVSHFYLDSEVRPTIYVPYTQHPIRALNFVVQSDAPFEQSASRVRAAARAVDASQQAYDFQSLSRFFTDLSGAIGVITALMEVFAVIALALSAAGVYAVMAYSVAQRSQEIGIRMALGADPKDVWKLVVGKALRMVGIGLVIALPVAFGLSRVMVSALSGIIALDPVAFLTFAALPAAMAVLASYLPARRATSIDPLVALRLD